MPFLLGPIRLILELQRYKDHGRRRIRIAFCFAMSKLLDEESTNVYEMQYHIGLLQKVIISLTRKMGRPNVDADYKQAHFEMYNYYTYNIKVNLLAFFPNVLCHLIMDYLVMLCSECHFARIFHGCINRLPFDMLNCVICDQWFCLDTGCFRIHNRTIVCEKCGKWLFCSGVNHECKIESSQQITKKRKKV